MRNMTYGLLFMAVLAGSAQAAMNTNGLSSNGLTTNGLTTNGVTSNGTNLNGLSSNGTNLNGLRSNGVRGKTQNSQLNSLLKDAGSHALVGRR